MLHTIKYEPDTTILQLVLSQHVYHNSKILLVENFATARHCLFQIKQKLATRTSLDEIKEVDMHHVTPLKNFTC